MARAPAALGPGAGARAPLAAPAALQRVVLSGDQGLGPHDPLRAVTAKP